MNLKKPPVVAQKGRYGNSSSIVASARNEFDNYQTALPRSRLSMQTTGMGKNITITSASKGYPAPGGKLSIGLPPMRMTNNSINSIKNLNASGTSEHISLYRNDDERQNMMKQIEEQ